MKNNKKDNENRSDILSNGLKLPYEKESIKQPEKRFFVDEDYIKKLKEKVKNKNG